MPITLRCVCVTGEVIVFDNDRLMHGRDAFPLTANSHRHLETVYVDIDTLQSTKMAMLEKQNKKMEEFDVLKVDP